MIGITEEHLEDASIVSLPIKGIESVEPVQDVIEDDVIVLSSKTILRSETALPTISCTPSLGSISEVPLEECHDRNTKRIKLDDGKEIETGHDLSWFDKALIPPKWLSIVDAEMSKGYFKKLCEKIDKEESALKIYPPRSLRFSFMDNDPSLIKVIIIGQDPYHGAGQAHGLSFSVEKGTKVPPSLKNIYKELKSDLGDSFQIPDHGNLRGWAEQGVLLLNACLTVQDSKPNSHSRYGWDLFTDAIIRKLTRSEKRLVVMLWGGFAQKKGTGILAAHPSPLGANKGGWFGTNHFSKANEWLVKRGETPIDWNALP